MSPFSTLFGCFSWLHQYPRKESDSFKIPTVSSPGVIVNDAVIVQGPNGTFSTHFSAQFPISCRCNKMIDSYRSTEDQPLIQNSDVLLFCNNHRLNFSGSLDKNGFVVFPWVESTSPDVCTDLTFLNNFLNSGINTFICFLPSQGLAALIELYVVNYKDQLVICDVDGTITKSDFRGFIETVILGRYSFIHSGVSSFLSAFSVLQDSYVPTKSVKVIYMSARPINLLNQTKSFLRHSSVHLPLGPIILNPTGLCEALWKDISGKSNDFKTHALRQLRNCYSKAGAHYSNESTSSNFILGLGNRQSDFKAYNDASIPKHRILIIDSLSKITSGDFEFQGYDDVRLKQEILRFLNVDE